MYYVLLNSKDIRDGVIAVLREEGIGAIFHYIPLHDSPAGKRYGRSIGKMKKTTELSQRLLRLPLWIGLPDEVIDRISQILERHAR